MNTNTLYNNSSLIFSKTWNGANYIPYDGEIRVNPVTLEISGNYLFRDEIKAYSERSVRYGSLRI
jgi:hypothetical protein